MGAKVLKVFKDLKDVKGVKDARGAAKAHPMVYLCIIRHISCKLSISHIVAEESTTFLR